MDAARLRRHFVAVMAKHLPPSGAALDLLDLDGRTGDRLAQLRADLQATHIPAQSLAERELPPDHFDAVAAYDIDLKDDVLRSCLAALRPGGRLIALQSRGEASEAHLRRLRAHGYVRILVEPALDELGVLIRGEKPHSTANTRARVQAVADVDADALDLARFNGRFLHLLIRQRPNKPIWKLAAGEKFSWRAAALLGEKAPRLLGFSSLPKAVAFMQGAVLAGAIQDINKVGKFSRATAGAWKCDLLLNPTLDSVDAKALTFIEIDPATAEAPDE